MADDVGKPDVVTGVAQFDYEVVGSSAGRVGQKRRDIEYR